MEIYDLDMLSSITEIIVNQAIKGEEITFEPANDNNSEDNKENKWKNNINGTIT